MTKAICFLAVILALALALDQALHIGHIATYVPNFLVRVTK